MLWIQVFDVAWLTSILLLLLLIWHSSEARLKHVLRLETMLIDVSTKNAESVRLMVVAVQDVIEMLKKEQE